MSDDSAPGIRDQGAISFVGMVVDAGVSFGGLVLFAYLLGAQGIGGFYAALALVQVALFPVNGLGQAIKKRGSEYGEQPDRYLGVGLTLGAGYLALVAATTVALTYGAGVTGSFTRPQVFAALGVFCTKIGFLFVNDAYRAQGKTGFATLADNALGVAETVTQVAFILIDPSVTSLLLGTVLATAVSTVAHLMITSVSVARPDTAAVGRLVTFARWTIPNAGIGTAYDRLPVLALYAFATPSLAGIYTAANRLLVPGSFVGGSLSPALMIRSSHRSSDDAEENLLEDLDSSLRYAGVVAIPIFFGALVIPEKLMVTVFGPDFAAGAGTLVVLAVYHIVNSADTITYSFVEGIGRPEFSLRSTLLSLVIRATLLFPLIATYGAFGAAVGIVVSHLLKFMYAQFVLFDLFDRPSVPRGVVYQLLSALMMSGVVAGLAGIVSIGSWGSLLGIVTVGAVCYSIVLLVVDEQFRAIVMELLTNMWD